MDTRTVPSTGGSLRAVICGILTMALLLGGTGPADAHVRVHTDADDVTGPFDLREVSLDREGSILTSRVRTFDRLRDRDFVGGGAFFVKLDTRGGPRADFTLRMDYYEGAYPYCTLYDSDGFSRYGSQATKGLRSFTCSLPFETLEATRHIRWRVVASPPSAAGADRAPGGQRWFSH